MDGCMHHYNLKIPIQYTAALFFEILWKICLQLHELLIDKRKRNQEVALMLHVAECFSLASLSSYVHRGGEKQKALQ